MKYILFINRGWFDESIGTLDTDDPDKLRRECKRLSCQAEPVAELDKDIIVLERGCIDEHNESTN